MMVEIDQKKYASTIKLFTNIPYQLSLAWVEYNQSKGKKILFFTNNLFQPKIVCWGISRKSRLFGQILDIKGPGIKEGTTVRQLQEFLEELKYLNHNGILLNPRIPYSSDFEIAARKALFKRPIGQSFTNLTIHVNTYELNPDRNWKRNVQKARTENFTFEIKKELSQNDCCIVAGLSKENAMRRKVSGYLDPEEVEQLMRNSNIFTCLVYNNQNPLAARIISIEQEISYDIFACNSTESRKNGANHFLMENLFNYLRRNQIRYFDFSGIPVGKKDMHGIYEFKKSSGGKVVQTNGEWCWFKSKWTRQLLYMYNLLINKQEFY